MAFKVGRFGKPITVPEPEVWDQKGGTITVSGKVFVSPNTDAVRLRDQLLGYLDNPDEPIVPVIMDSEPRLTGYYRVVDVAVPTDQKALSVGALTYSVTLEPVAGFAQPYLESVISGALLTNVVGAVAADGYQFHVVPSVAMEYFREPQPLVYTRGSADGDLSLFTTNGAGLGQVAAPASFALTPANFYIGACTIEQGSPLQPVVGMMLAQPDLVNWRLSNGLVRVTPNGTAGKLDISHWDWANAWSTPKTYQITGTTLAGALYNPRSLTIARNSVEECVIRLGCASSVQGIAFGRINLDISLRRGDRLARIYLTSDRADQWQVKRDTTEAATAITYGAVTLGGIRATNNDGDINRYVLLSYQAAVTSDLVNGKLTQNALSTTMDIGIGLESGGASASAPDRAFDLAQQYLAMQSEAQRVVKR